MSESIPSKVITIDITMSDQEYFLETKFYAENTMSDREIKAVISSIERNLHEGAAP